MKLDAANEEVTAAILHAERQEYGTDAYRAAWRRVLDAEQRIVELTAAETLEGDIARRGVESARGRLAVHIGGGPDCADCERYDYKPFECVSCHGMFGGCMGNGDDIDYEHGPLCDDCAVKHPAWKAPAAEARVDGDALNLRKVQRALRRSLRNTAGHLRDDGIDVEWGGACPVQGYGEVDGRPVYFRARHTDVRLDFFPAATDPHEDYSLTETWSFDEEYAGPEHNAGWITSRETAGFIRRAVAAWRTAGRP